MSEFASDHGKICAEFLSLSREYLASGRLLQASEKGWGAAAHAAKLFAGARDGLEHERHDQFEDVVTEIGMETNSHQQVHRWANNANRLHRNFYDDNMEARGIEARLADVANFVNLIRWLTGLPPVNN